MSNKTVTCISWHELPVFVDTRPSSDSSRLTGHKTSLKASICIYISVYRREEKKIRGAVDLYPSAVDSTSPPVRHQPPTDPSVLSWTTRPRSRVLVDLCPPPPAPPVLFVPPTVKLDPHDAGFPSLRCASSSSPSLPCLTPNWMLSQHHLLDVSTLPPDDSERDRAQAQKLSTKLRPFADRTVLVHCRCCTAILRHSST